MYYFKSCSLALILSLLFFTAVFGQEDQSDELENVFADLIKNEGWGPFSPREGFEPEHYTATFTISGEDYKVYQLLHTDKSNEQRFIFQKVNADVSFSEEEGAPVYYRREEINLEGTNFEITGYSEKADQFVLIEKEKVNYIREILGPETEAPNFQAKSLQGQTISLSDYKGQYVLLDFWGTWCGPCLAETPYLKEAYQQFGDRVQFVGIAVDYEKSRVEKYLQQKNIQWPQIFIQKDSNNPAPLVEKYKVFGYPSMFLINPEGRVIIGFENKSRLRGLRLSETLEKVVIEN